MSSVSEIAPSAGGWPVIILVALGVWVLLYVLRDRRPSTPASADMPNPRSTSSSDTCPVCVDAPSFAVTTPCGHTFCAECWAAHAQSRHPPDPARFPSTPPACPMCRAQVCAVVPAFTSAERADVRRAGAASALVHGFNRAHAGESTGWWSRIRMFPPVLRALLQDVRARPVLMLASSWVLRILITLFLQLVYLLSPIDILPEAALGPLGLIDDVAVLLFGALAITDAYMRAMADENAEVSPLAAMMRAAAVLAEREARAR